MKQYQFGDAFKLMHYACDRCGHHEVIWNSRDGVTPFGTSCPSCGAIELRHIAFHLDICDPHHTLHHYQRYWRDGTTDEAIAIFQARMKQSIETVKARRDLSDSEKFDRIEHIDQALRETTIAIRAGTCTAFPLGWPKLDVHLPHSVPA